MKHYSIILLILLFLVSCGEDSPEVKSLDREVVLQNIGENVVVPFHQDFQKECQNLHEITKTFQNNPSEDQLLEVQNQWKATQTAWKKCEIFEFGTARDLFMHNKIGKWETNTGFIEQNLGGSETLDANFVQNSGSTSKGLPAIEFLLFGKTASNSVQKQLESFISTPTAARKRQYLMAMTADLLTQSTELQQVWQGEISDFQVKTENGIQGSLNILVNAQISLLEEVVNSKLGKPLGKDNGGIPNPEDAEAFRSGFSLDLIRANLEGVQASFQGTENMGLSQLQELRNYKQNERLLYENIDNQFNICFTEFGKLQKPLSEMVTTEPEKLEDFYTATRDLLVLFKVDLASALSITVTFNDNDGD